MIARATSFASFEGLAVLQLTHSRQETFFYVHADGVIASGALEIAEVDGAGSVNLVSVVNHSGEFVFLMDGDILAGARQNRVVNTSVLLAPRSKTTVPVSCVEHGRWSPVSQRFSGTDYAAPTSLRGAKARTVKENLRRNGAFMADQGEVWSRVAHFEAAMAAPSRTSNLSDLFEARRIDLERLVAAVRPDPEASGVAVYLGRDLASADLFNRRDVFAHCLPKILRGAALDALAAGKTLTGVKEAEASFRAVDLIDRIDDAEKERHDGAGVGAEYRFDIDGMSGFQLEHERHLVHLAALRAGRRG